MLDTFRLKQNNTGVMTEILAGVTTFFAVSYTLTVTPAILETTGMPYAGVFAACVLTSAVCTLLMALYANTPFAVAPGMGLNTFFAHTLCMGMGFHWREALAVVFVSSLLHIVVMATRARPVLIASFPPSLKFGISVGIGLFISYVGMKNAGLLTFIISPGAYTIAADGMVVADSSAYPSLIGTFSMSHLVSFIGLAVTLYLLGMEHRSGDRYAPFLMGIIVATFIGIPLDITDISAMRLITFDALFEVRHIWFGFFGDPGLMSLAADPARLTTAIAMILVLAFTDIVDSLAAIAGTGHLAWNTLFPQHGTRRIRNSVPLTPEEEAERETDLTERLDRSLVANSFGGTVSALFGTSTSTAYIESVTGIAAGGRTGLTAMVTAILFFLCLPFAGLFSIIPGEALAPALIISGMFLVSLVAQINWSSHEEALPAATCILFMAVSFSILNGITAGFICHIILQVAYGKARSLKPALVMVALALTLVAMMQNILEWL